MAAGDGVHNTIGWTGLPVGGTLQFHLNYTATDSLSNTATSRYPATGSVIVNQ